LTGARLSRRMRLPCGGGVQDVETAADLSAQQPPPEEDPRVPGAHEDEERPGRAGPASRERAQAPFRLRGAGTPERAADRRAREPATTRVRSKQRQTAGISSGGAAQGPCRVQADLRLGPKVAGALHRRVRRARGGPALQAGGDGHEENGLRRSQEPSQAPGSRDLPPVASRACGFWNRFRGQRERPDGLCPARHPS
jgi:hypothetical protein